MWPSNRIDAQRRGFTLLELLVVVAMLAILVSLAVMSASSLSRRELSREAARAMMSIAHEARSTAILLGTTRGTQRVILDPSCPAEFSVGTPPNQGTSALVLQPGATTCPPGLGTPPCDLVTYVKRVERATPPGAWTGDTYTLFCETTNIRGLVRDTARMTFVDMEGAGGRFRITFDDRGLITDLAGRKAARVTFGETDTMVGATPSISQTVVILGSGLACYEGGGEYECAKN